MSFRLISMKFVDREEELEMLKRAYSSGRSELVIVYGRRRIGKTYLLSFFIRDKSAVFLVVNYGEPELALRDLVDQLLSQVKLPYRPKVESFSELYSLLGSLGVRMVVLDEFQRLHGSGGVTELQSVWDRVLSRCSVVFVLAGSSVGMMEKIGLSVESPLYGRATRILKLSSLKYSSVRAFVPRYKEVDKVRTYAVFGGTPGYLARVNDEKSLLENILDLVLRPGAPLRNEPRTLLSMELREPSRYLQILRVIAEGATRLGEIADKSGIRVSEVGKYLRILEGELDLVERKYPLLEEGRKGRARYYLKDNFFKFWFKMVFPNQALLELGLYGEVAEKIWSEMDIYTSRVFEEVALQHFVGLARRSVVSFSKIGKWWSRNVEIDFVAVDPASNTAYFAEVKWSDKPLDKRVLYSLVSKAESFPWKKAERKNIYVLYNKSGFSFSKEEDVWLFSLEDMKRDFDREVPMVKYF